MSTRFPQANAASNSRTSNGRPHPWRSGMHTCERTLLAAMHQLLLAPCKHARAQHACMHAAGASRSAAPTCVRDGDLAASAHGQACAHRQALALQQHGRVGAACAVEHGVCGPQSDVGARRGACGAAQQDVCMQMGGEEGAGANVTQQHGAACKHACTRMQGCMRMQPCINHGRSACQCCGAGRPRKSRCNRRARAVRRTDGAAACACACAHMAPGVHVRVSATKRHSAPHLCWACPSH